MSDVTVKKYVDYLRQTFLIQLLTKHSFKSKERIRNAKAYIVDVSVSAMLVYTRQKNIAQAFILERYFFVSICPAASHGTCLSVFLAAVLLLC